MGIPTNAELKEKLTAILKEANLETFTKRAARRELEKAFSLGEGDLEEKKQDIAEWVEEYIEKENEKESDNEASGDEKSNADQNSDSESDNKEEDEDKKGSSKSKKAKGARGWKPQYLKPALAEFVGADQMKRTEVVKKIWDHVRSNNLQDPKNRQFFIADEKLMKVFGVNAILRISTRK